MATVEPGAVIGGRYQLIRTIGTGGMAKVWLAHDRLLDREVAVKILAERYASDPDFVERFRREASAAAGLSHPNIVTVYDRGETDGSYYIVMEHLPGPDLKEIIRQRGRLAPRQAVDAALQVLAALSAAHRRNVIHRDIKPQNVLVAEDGHLKVTDFGIARAGDDAGVTEVGSVIGTAQYLSPEQARGEEVTGASDCYAAGVLLYEMLTGRVPFDGDKPVAIAMRQINETPTAPRVLVPQIPPQLNEIVMKSLEKRPGSRYRTAEEFSAALMAVRPSLPEPAEDATAVLAALESPATTRIITRATEPARATTGRTPLPPPPPRRRRGPLIAALIALLLLAGGAAAFFLTDVGRSSNVAIPSVHGQAEAVARATLIAAGFRVRVDQQASSDVPAGSAIGTDPPEGSGASRNSEVVLIVSTGGELAIVPDLVGDSYDDAAATLTRLNFGVKKVVDFSEKPVGTVFDQTPVGNKEARQGDVVTLFVSKGPELVDVPALKLKTRTQAEDLLKAAGLTLGTVSERESSSRPAGTVLDQDPAGGTTAPKGSAVDIVVAKAPVVTTIAMPSVVGNTAASARQKLQGLGFADPIATTVPSPIAAGTVIDQDPPAGRQVDPSRTPVTLTVSGGITQVPTDPGPLPGVP